MTGSRRLHSKASLLKMRKYQKIRRKYSHVLYKIASPKSESCFENGTSNFIKTGLLRWQLPRNVPTFFSQAISQNTFQQLIGKGAHLFIESSHYCFDRAATLFIFRILVKSHKSLKGIKSFARRYSIKKIKKIKSYWKEPLMESFYYKVTIYNITEKELHRRCFPVTFSKFFRTVTFFLAAAKSKDTAVYRELQQLELYVYKEIYATRALSS